MLNQIKIPFRCVFPYEKKKQQFDLGQPWFENSPATLLRLGFHAMRIFGGQLSQPCPTNRLRMQENNRARLGGETT